MKYILLLISLMLLSGCCEHTATVEVKSPLVYFENPYISTIEVPLSDPSSYRNISYLLDIKHGLCFFVSVYYGESFNVHQLPTEDCQNLLTTYAGEQYGR